MSTDWVQVVVCLAWGLGIGGGMFLCADSIAALQSKALGPKHPRMASRLSPALVRAGGIGFGLLGCIGAVLGLFFADRM